MWLDHWNEPGYKVSFWTAQSYEDTLEGSEKVQSYRRIYTYADIYILKHKQRGLGFWLREGGGKFLKQLL